MDCFAGTAEGVRRVDLASGDARPLFESGPIYTIGRDPAGRWLAGGEDGLFRSPDGGATWTSQGLDAAVHAVKVVPGTDRLLVGTSPPQVYYSDDDGGTWRRSSAFSNLPDRSTWRWGGDTEGGLAAVRVVDLGVDPAAPERVYAAVESVGVFRSEDGGRTWRRADRGLVADPHDLTLLSPTDVVAATGDGLYRTDTAGETWYRLDTARALFWFSYASATTVHDGAMYTAVEDRSEYRSDAVDGARSLLLRSTDGGRTFEWSVPPGETRTAEVTGTVSSFVRAFTVADGTVLGATRDGRVFGRAADGDWRSEGALGAETYALRGSYSPTGPS